MTKIVTKHWRKRNSYFKEGKLPMMKEDGGESLETRKNVYVSCGIKEMK